jgi:hypothetical protein
VRSDLARVIPLTVCRICHVSIHPGAEEAVRVNEDGLQRCGDCKERKDWRLAQEGGLLPKTRANLLARACVRRGHSLKDFYTNARVSAFIAEGGDWLPDVIDAM